MTPIEVQAVLVQRERSDLDHTIKLDMTGKANLSLVIVNAINRCIDALKSANADKNGESPVVSCDVSASSRVIDLLKTSKLFSVSEQMIHIESEPPWKKLPAAIKHIADFPTFSLSSNTINDDSYISVVMAFESPDGDKTFFGRVELT